MSDLRTLFISQSYTSLIHTSNDDAVPTGSYIELEDGSGNSLGIEVNRDGNFKVQGELSASLVNGIGNVTAYSASVDSRINNISTGSGADITQLNDFTASQLTINDGYNQFTESAEARLDNIEIATASYNDKFDTIGTQSGSWGSGGDVTALNDFTASQLTINSGYNSYTQSTDSRLDNIETTTASLQTQINNIDTGSLLETASVSLNTITFTKADSSTFDITVDTGSSVDISSLNQFTASADIRLDNLELFTGSVATNFVSQSDFNTYSQSVDTEQTQQNDRLSSLENETGSYATLGTNTFSGKQFLSGSDQGIEIGSDSDPSQFANLQLKVSETTYPGFIYNTIVINNDGSYTGFEVQGPGGSVTHKMFMAGDEIISRDADSNWFLNMGTSIMQYSSSADFYIYPNVNLQGGIDAQTRSTFFGGLEVQNGFTASLSEGYVWVGNPLSKSTQISTGSLFTGLATLESNTFSGSQTITGSVNGNVESLTIASSTASIDCSQGNFFTLTLPTGSTHLTATNIEIGQTISLRIDSQFGANVSIDESTIKFPIGNDYVPSVSSSYDLLTFVSFDTNSLFGVATNLYNK